MRTLILALCLLAVPAAAQQMTIDPQKAVVGRDAPNSTASFVAICQKEVAWCDGYLAGAAASQTQPPTCSPPGMKGTDFRPKFFAWYQRNPQAADLMASLSIIRFNSESFPCATRS